MLERVEIKADIIFCWLYAVVLIEVGVSRILLKTGIPKEEEDHLWQTQTLHVLVV